MKQLTWESVPLNIATGSEAPPDPTPDTIECTTLACTSMVSSSVITGTVTSGSIYTSDIDVGTCGLSVQSGALEMSSPHKIAGVTDGTEDDHVTTKGQMDSAIVFAHNDTVGSATAASISSTHNNSVGTATAASILDTNNNMVGTATAASISSTHNNSVGAATAASILDTHNNMVGTATAASISSTHNNSVGTATASSIATRLPRDGSQAMSGNLDLNGYHLVDVWNIAGYGTMTLSVPNSNNDFAFSINGAQVFKLETSAASSLKPLNMLNNKITSVGYPSSSGDAASKLYVDTIVPNYLFEPAYYFWETTTMWTSLNTSPSIIKPSIVSFYKSSPNLISYSVSTGRYTIQRSGVFHIALSLTFYTSTEEERRARACIYFNEVLKSEGANSLTMSPGESGNHYSNVSVNAILPMSNGNYFDIRCETDSGGAGNVFSSSHGTIHQIA